MPPKSATKTPAPNFSMSLAPYERDALRVAGVNASPNINPFRQSNGRWVLRGDESGGGGKAVGHYIGYAPVAGIPFLTEQRIKFVPNAMHRRVFGPVLMCFEVFRYEQKNVHTRISLHSVLQSAKASSPNGHNHSRRILFQERFGAVASDNIPAFISSAGENVTVPAFLLDGFQRAYAGSKCPACRDCHFDGIAPVSIPTELLRVFAIPTPAEKV
jgi:hypothetical protein